MATAIVKWYNDAKGFGFAIDHDSKELVLLERINIVGELPVVFEFDVISYDPTQGPKGPIALNITVLREKDMSFYDHEFITLDGDHVHLSKYTGKVILAVNTASLCGYTAQYKGLEWLFNSYKNDGLVVLGFTSDDFGNQEFATSEETKDFCEKEFNTTFPIFKKTSVKGETANSFYKLIKEKTNGEPQWNFHKYLINKDATEIREFNSDIRPPMIQNEIKRMLSQ